ncbi:MAG: alcohol dehydrogenase catalytic domain-containing protein [Pseudomonadota bacterium]
MKQAVMTEAGAIEFHDVVKPVIKDNEVLLRVERIGICGTDIHVYHGKHPFTSFPVVQGHEFSATVVDVGSAVKSVRPHMRVTARPQLVCGRCGPCRRGDYHICDHLKVTGFQAPGCAQEYFVVSEDRIVKLADNLSFEQGAMIEPVAVAVHATSRATDLRGKNVVVCGAGTIGNFVAQAAKCRGAKSVLITDMSAYRLDKAKQCGVDVVCNLSEENFADKAKQVFSDEGFSIAFEAVGVEAALDNAVQQIQKGGQVIVVGVYGDRPKVDMSVVGDRELSLVGTLMYKHEDFEQAVAWLSSGKIVTDPLVTGHFDFKDYLEAYHYIEKQKDKTLKIMIDVH